jgi:hypothetical protein
MWRTAYVISVTGFCATVGHSVGLRTINEQINQLEPLVHQFHNAPLEQVPEVVQLDGIWVTIPEQARSGTRFFDAIVREMLARVKKR